MSILGIGIDIVENYRIKKILVNKKLDIQTLNDLEELLIMADLGPSAAEKLTAELANEKFDKNIKPEEVKTFLAKKIEETLVDVAKPLILNNSKTPSVVLVVGVNGTGKTTTIGKLAHQYSSEGKKIMILINKIPLYITFICLFIPIIQVILDYNLNRFILLFSALLYLASYNIPKIKLNMSFLIIIIIVIIIVLWLL